jgi:hypothetical protein
VNSPGRGGARPRRARPKDQRKGQDRRGASRSCRTDNAVEHSAGVPHCSIHTSDLGGPADHKRKLTKRIDGLQRFEQRLDQRSRSMIVALLDDRPRSGLARSATAADGWRAAAPRLLPHRRCYGGQVRCHGGRQHVSASARSSTSPAATSVDRHWRDPSPRPRPRHISARAARHHHGGDIMAVKVRRTAHPVLVAGRAQRAGSRLG